MGNRLQASGATLDGLDLSGFDDDGVQWALETFEGWSGSSGSTLALTQKAAGHGAWRSQRPRFAARVLTATGSIVHDDPELVSLAADRLNDAVSLDPVRLLVDEGRRSRWMTVQRQDDVIIDDSLETCYRYSLQLVAVDPFKYGDTITRVTGLPSTAGGLAVPFGVPASIDSVVASGVVAAVNPGNQAGPVMLRIDGPVLNPTIRHTAGNGASSTFAVAIDLGVGDWLDVDMRRELALANGTADRAGQITRRGWSLFQPGVNSWAFSSPQPSPDARLTVAVIPAWK